MDEREVLNEDLLSETDHRADTRIGKRLTKHEAMNECGSATIYFHLSARKMWIGNIHEGFC